MARFVYVCKRTHDLSSQDKSQFLRLFSKVFTFEMTAEQFERKYVRTPFGYSYHGLMLTGDTIAGAYNVIPYNYRYFGKRLVFGLSVDLMVDQEYRGGSFNLLNISRLVLDYMREDGICFTFGFPNDNAYDFTIKALRWRGIGELDYYILPRNIGALFPKLRVFNILSRAGAALRMTLQRPNDQITYQFGIEKVYGADFLQHRYDTSYTMFNMDGFGTGVCKIYLEPPGIRTLYLIDVEPLTRRCFDEAVRQAYTQCGDQADLILYVGRLPFKPGTLIRLPESRRPRRIRMCGKLLDPDVVDERVFDLNNWNVNISNFDVR